MAVPPNHIHVQNNLSNHPIHVLKNAHGSRHSDAVSSPLPPSSLADERNLLLVEGSQSDVGYMGARQAANMPSYGAGPASQQEADAFAGNLGQNPSKFLKQ